MSHDQSSLPDAEVAPPAGEPEPQWLRLDKRKLLLDPVSAVKQSIVPIIAVLVGASSSDNLWWAIAAPVLAVAAALFGLVPWFTTTYRITPTQFQLRKGVFNKTTSTAPLDRVRSVDLEATLLHRILGMRKVQIGTGVDDERIELDAVTIARAEELRELLLRARRAAAVATSPSPVGAGSGLPAAGAPWGGTDQPPAAAWPGGVTHPVEEAAPEQVLAVFTWSWVRFAPFNLARLAVIAAAVGAVSQLVGEVSIDAAQVAESAESALRIGVVVLSLLVFLGLAVTWLVVSVVGYVVQWWGLRLTRAHGSLHLSSGLLTTRSITVEEKRVRGVELVEPLLMRVVNGAALSTLATGVGEGGTTSILPHCPTPVAVDVASDVLGDDRPMRMPLVPHGPAARRRQHVAHQWTTLFFLGLGLVGHYVVSPLAEVATQAPLWWFLAPGLAWIPIGVVLAELSYAHLGHALTDDHLVAGHGTTARRRTVLEVDGIIGWVFEQSIFQRRLGLVTLQATTAAGGEKVTLTDVPEHLAVRLAARATPEPLEPYLAR
ncbi:PH domain-containing protein [Nocardioides sp. Y6]|uniref:PH domain-containing protein n=1 Tax=Nocardioides malaquae TaxID=2773426 RepID=A0ABR9RQQ2_9ACTN|nr:PH domain-containing protein [Nocardioides malaquae]MBE7323889.1 PH domain-containing protein [Nocardioides malaquae]